MKNKSFIHEIDRYCEEAGIQPTTFGRMVGQGGTFYKRLIEGGRNWPETEAKVRQFMKDNPPRKPVRAAS